MVYRHKCILDGYNNYINFNIDNMGNTDYFQLCFRRNMRTVIKHDMLNTVTVTNDNYKPAPAEFIEFFDLVMKLDVDHPKYKLRNTLFIDQFGMEKINKYLDIVPFNDSLMLNISPKWSEGSEGISEGNKIRFLRKIIDSFIHDSGRFLRTKYVIECGKNGDHIHAHCVLELDPKLKKSNKTWISKHNHIRDFRNIWKRFASAADMSDSIDSKHALQSILIKNRNMLKDKLDYLVEQLKPLSHQNAQHPQLPQIVGEW